MWIKRGSKVYGGGGSDGGKHWEGVWRGALGGSVEGSTARDCGGEHWEGVVEGSIGREWWRGALGGSMEGSNGRGCGGEHWEGVVEGALVGVWRGALGGSGGGEHWEGVVEGSIGRECGGILTNHCSIQQDNNSALHLAARKDQVDCVRALLYAPGIDMNIKNNSGRTAMMEAGYKSLGLFNKVIKTCSDYPAHSYGKVVLFGNFGAGKSTLTQVSQWDVWDFISPYICHGYILLCHHFNSKGTYIILHVSSISVS